MAEPTVFLVDDDDGVRQALALLLESEDLPVEPYPSATAFLAAYQPGRPACLLTDLRMPETDGLQLQEEMLEHDPDLPVIFLTGQADVSAAVDALKKGALDFFEKPIRDEEAFLGRIREALDLSRGRLEAAARRRLTARRLESLTAREHEVAELVAQGKANKVVATDLGISERTVEIHRRRAMQKLGVRNVAQLLRLLTDSR